MPHFEILLRYALLLLLLLGSACARGAAEENPYASSSDALESCTVRFAEFRFLNSTHRGHSAEEAFDHVRHELETTEPCAPDDDHALAANGHFDRFNFSNCLFNIDERHPTPTGELSCTTPAVYDGAGLRPSGETVCAEVPAEIEVPAPVSEGAFYGSYFSVSAGCVVECTSCAD